MSASVYGDSSRAPIRLGIAADDSIAQSIARHRRYFLSEVLGTELVTHLNNPDYEKEVNLNGVLVHIHIARV